MPSLGSDMERAVLIEWLVEPGTEVKRGDLIAVVETDTGAIEIEVFEDGWLERYLVEIDTEVDVGEPLAEIRGAQSEISDDRQQHRSAPQTRSATADQPSFDQQPAKVAPHPAPGRRISPAARQLAFAHGLDIRELTGSGPQGAVVYEDVAALLPSAEKSSTKETPVKETPAKKPPATQTAPADGLTNMRRAIAAAMARSKREIPHYYLASTIDVEPAIQWLSEVNADKAPAERILASALFIKATALALRKFPEFNGLYEAEAYHPSEPIHVGVAIAIRGGGLVAPAIHHTDQLTTQQLMAYLRDLTQRVRAGRYRAAEFRDPTVTVTSLGDRGVEQVYGVIYPPQVACIGFGKVVDRPWSQPDRSITSRSTVTVSLAADHRVSDGRRGALLLNAINKLLEFPAKL